MITFSNPRLLAEFDDWPSRHDRVKCCFTVEHHAKRGFRVLRQTMDKYGNWCKPKAKTFSGQAAIVDGSDGRTYILQVADRYGFITISSSDFMNARFEGQEATVFHEKQPEYHKHLLGLILQAGALMIPS